MVTVPRCLFKALEGLPDLRKLAGAFRWRYPRLVDTSVPHGSPGTAGEPSFFDGIPLVWTSR